MSSGMSPELSMESGTGRDNVTVSALPPLDVATLPGTLLVLVVRFPTLAICRFVLRLSLEVVQVPMSQVVSQEVDQAGSLRDRVIQWMLTALVVGPPLVLASIVVLWPTWSGTALVKWFVSHGKKWKMLGNALRTK